jgi:predicted lipoprotein with Yx(FWY)xxD motif
MKKSSIIWLVVIVVVVIGGIWWWMAMNSSPSSVATTQTTTTSTSTTGTSPTSPTNPTTGTTATPTSSLSTLTLNNAGGGKFGAYLSGSNGMTLYQSTKDTTNVSNCTGACATEWPPYTVSAAAATSLTADPGIAGTIGTIKRANGSLQVTYRGLPLYFYLGDAKKGDTNGEAIDGFTEVAP